MVFLSVEKLILSWPGCTVEFEFVTSLFNFICYSSVTFLFLLANTNEVRLLGTRV